MLWRQGDIYVETTTSIPPTAIVQTHLVLADGEVTGHQHRIADITSAILFEDRGQLFLDVVADLARLIHQEHNTIQLPRGRYRVWRQREFDPIHESRIRMVLD